MQCIPFPQVHNYFVELLNITCCWVARSFYIYDIWLTDDCPVGFGDSWFKRVTSSFWVKCFFIDFCDGRRLRKKGEGDAGWSTQWNQRCVSTRWERGRSIRHSRQKSDNLAGCCSMCLVHLVLVVVDRSWLWVFPMPQVSFPVVSLVSLQVAFLSLYLSWFNYDSKFQISDMAAKARQRLHILFLSSMKHNA